MRNTGTNPPLCLAIWKYQKAGVNGRELATPSLSALWQRVDVGKGNSHEAKERTMTGS